MTFCQENGCKSQHYLDARDPRLPPATVKQSQESSFFYFAKLTSWFIPLIFSHCWIKRRCSDDFLQLTGAKIGPATDGRPISGCVWL